MSATERRRVLTEQERQEIRDLCAGGMLQKDVAQLVGCSRITVGRIVNGWSSSTKKRTEAGTTRVCPHCKGKLAVQGRVRFCYHCGADLRSEGVKLIPELEKVLGTISSVYPTHMRDHAVATLNRAIDILKEAD